MNTTIRALIIEDSADDLLLLTEHIRAAGTELIYEQIQNVEEFSKALDKDQWDVILADHSLPKFDSHKALLHLKSRGMDIPFIIVSGVMGEEAAVNAMRAGAHDYIMKGNLARLGVAIEREVREARIRREKRQAVARLEESEERFRNIADAAPVLIWMANELGELEFFSQPWLNYTGVPLEKQVGRGWLALVEPNERDACERAYRAFFEKREPFEMELRLKRADGSFGWILNRATPRFTDGKFIGFIGCAIDITERHLAQAEIKRAYASAQIANRMKDEFLATVSHELRTPLNSIIGHSELLRFEIPGTPEFSDSVSAIHRNGLAQLGLIGDLLDVSRIIRGDMTLSVRPADPEQILRNVITSLEFTARAKGIAIHKEFENNVGLVLADHDRIQQVFWNLLSNAIKFTQRNGTVTVRTRRSKSRVEIELSDNGRGIDPAFLPYVFDRFRQEQSTSTRTFGGLGIGLAISKQLVELHAGTIAAFSNGLGHGSTFTVCLPPLALSDTRSFTRSEVLTASDPETSFSLVGTLPHVGGTKILAIDDDEETRTLLSKVLTKAGALVTSASSASQGFELFKQQQFDFILCDVGMEGEDGYSLIRKVRKLEQATNRDRTKAAALTAFAAPEDLKQALDAGFDMHLAKPVNPIYLINKISELAEPVKQGG